jgi:predicted Zn-dependent protease
VYDVGRLGGVVTYSYAGGVGMRTGDSADVNNAVRAALYNRALLDREQKNPAAAAREFSELGARFPNDPQIMLAVVGSMIQDEHQPTAALSLLAAMPVPPDTSRLWGRYQMARVDALDAAGQKDSARAVLNTMIAKFPNSARLKARLDKLK